MEKPASLRPIAPRALPPRNEFDEDAYLRLHPDVATAIAAGHTGSGWQHFTLHGLAEGRRWVSKTDPLIGVSREIAPDDEMFGGNHDHYFDVGASAMHCIEAALFTARRDKASIKAVLDLPCGSGRVMRFLHQAFPTARLTACDLNRAGTEFCAKAFGATAVVSQENPADIHLDEKFDLIWCGSLFTHFPEEKYAPFLQLFHRLLQPQGILVLSIHGRHSERELTTGHRYGLNEQQSAQILTDYRQRGFGYVDYAAESGYGISITRPAYLLANFIAPQEWLLLGYHESGWDQRQDVICLQRHG